MSSQLFKSFLRKASSSEGLSAFIKKQGPPGGPPRPGLQWKPSTHRWIRPQGDEEYDHQGQEIPYEHTLNYIRGGRSQIANHFLDQATSIAEEIKENSIGGSGSTKRIMARLKGLEQGEEYGLARLQDEISDVLRDSRINQYNSPTLIDLSQAINSVRREEKEAGLGESHIRGGHDAEDEQVQDKHRTKKYGTNEPVMEHRNERERKSSELKRQMDADLDEVFSPEAAKKRAENRRSRGALEAARSEAIRRNPGTDPSWYGR